MNPPSPAGQSWRDHIRVHPAADLFPMMPDSELDQLAADIAKTGVQQPIVWFRDQLIDGRNRVAAVCRKPDEKRRDEITAEWQNGKNCIVHLILPDPVGHVISANIHRRHLTAEQKREVVTSLLKAKPERSDRETAKIARSNRTTVGKIRRDLEQKGDVSIIDTRTDTKGRHQPATKPKAPSKIVFTETEIAEQIIEERKKARLAVAPPRSEDHLQGRSPEDFREATKLIGLLNHIARESGGIDVAAALRGMKRRELDDARRSLVTARGWLLGLGERLAPDPENRPDDTAMRGAAAAAPTAASITCCLPAGCRGYPGCKEGGRCLSVRSKPSDDDLAAAAKDTKAALAMLGGAE
jgi:hypothetical protein